MEKKTIGQFIAALRKANGMTQKELAEKLNVSDKAVSRWERDENAPDLSLIPVIAEIFGVTSDEILRGERAAVSETVQEYHSEKSRKQVAHLLENTKTRFKIMSLISIGIAGVGLIMAMVINLGFLRANLGFFVACIFFLAAFLCEGIFLTLQLSSLKLQDEDDEENFVGFARTRGMLRRGFATTVVGIACMIAFCLPLMEVEDAYWGLTLDYWIREGAGFALITAVVGAIVILIVSVKGAGDYWGTDEKERARNKRKLHYIKLTAIMIAATAIVEVGSAWLIVENDWFLEKTTFDTVEEFVKFMETPMNMYDTYNNSIEIMETEAMTDADLGDDDRVASDEVPAYRDYDELLGEDGEVICKYVNRNHTVYQIMYSSKEDGYLPIQVITWSAYTQRNEFINDVAVPIFGIIYLAEIAIGIWMYFTDKKKRNIR